MVFVVLLVDGNGCCSFCFFKLMLMVVVVSCLDNDGCCSSASKSKLYFVLMLMVFAVQRVSW